MFRLDQSSLISFYLFAAFIVFVTVRGELSTYVGFFVGGSGTPTPSGPTSNASLSSAHDQLTNAQTALLQGAQLAIIA